MIFASLQDKLSAMPVWKFLLRFLAIYAATFVLVHLIPEQIHRRDFDRVFFTWWKNRTPENEAALRVEQRKNEIIHLRDSALIAAFVVVIVGGIYKVVRPIRRP